jgi:hypothetical protein
MTELYNALTVQQKREIRMYGCTIPEMREAIEQSMTFRFQGPAAMAVSMMSDCQEMLAHDNGGSYDFMVVEDVRQMLNRAKFVLTNYKEQDNDWKTWLGGK